MRILLLFVFIAILLYLKLVLHLRIKLKTFFRKGFAPKRGQFGVYCFCGKQGKGKTYSVVEFLQDNKDKKIFCNIPNIKGINYTYFSHL